MMFGAPSAQVSDGYAKGRCDDPRLSLAIFTDRMVSSFDLLLPSPKRTAFTAPSKSWYRYRYRHMAGCYLFGLFFTNLDHCLQPGQGLSAGACAHSSNPNKKAGLVADLPASVPNTTSTTYSTPAHGRLSRQPGGAGLQASSTSRTIDFLLTMNKASPRDRRSRC
jgi:hypothetical protein